jgi:hypothetical protein
MKSGPRALAFNETEDRSIMKKAAELSYYRPPTATELKRIERMWQATSQGSRRNIPSSPVEKLSAYLHFALFDAHFRIEGLSSGSLSRLQAKQDKREVQKELKLCGKIGAYLIRLQLSSQRPR